MHCKRDGIVDARFFVVLLKKLYFNYIMLNDMGNVKLFNDKSNILTVLLLIDYT